MKRALLFLLLLTALVAAKSYGIPRAVITNEILADGSVLVTEEITFGFHGSYSYAYREFDFSRGGSISGFAVTEGGEPLDYEWSGDKVTWHYSAADEERTFTLAYTLTGAVKAYDDVAEFYWRVWGEGWDEPVQRLEAKVILPEKVGDESVLAWAHPALDGSITRLGGTEEVRFEVDGVPPGQWAEVRVAFPRSALSGVSGASVVNGDGLEKIMAQEEAWANPFPWFAVSLFCPLAVIAAFAIAYYYYGRDPDPRYEGEYEREVPDLPPAIAGALTRFGVEPGDLSATMLDLVQRKYLSMRSFKQKRKKLLFFESEHEEYEFAFKKPASGLHRFERLLLSEMRAASKGGKLLLSDWRRHLEYRARRGGDFYSKWKEAVMANLNARGLVEFEGRTKFLLFSAPFILLNLAIAFFDQLALVTFFVSAALWLVFSFAAKSALPRRTAEGSHANAKLLALQKFLRDFSLLNEKKPKDIVLWERYLVYATALGVADEVAEVMDASFTQAQRERSAFYHAGSFHYAVAFNASVNSSIAAASAAGGAGRGGGFSGGGGFGGGGGGGGAG